MSLEIATENVRKEAPLKEIGDYYSVNENYREPPQEILAAYKQLGFIPLRVTVEAIGFRVNFNPEENTSTIYNPSNPKKALKIPSFVAYGTAFSAQDAVAEAIQHIKTAPDIDENVLETVNYEAGVPEEPPMEVPTVGTKIEEIIPRNLWPREPQQQRAYMLQALQPEASIQHGMAGQTPTVDILRLQGLQHLLKQMHRS